MIYSKRGTDDKIHLYKRVEDGEDIQCTYKDADGSTLTDLTWNEVYYSAADRCIRRAKDDKIVNVFADGELLIGKATNPTPGPSKAKARVAQPKVEDIPEVEDTEEETE